ncbi:MAG TPA: acyltransferase [Acidobacteriaceae bacterium]|nr:acyltransferase [Acidobacteriaceae bacterium]
MRRDNNFDLLRLTLAWAVVLSHCKDLSLAKAFDPLTPLMQSGRAVEGFFAISGCLIVASWDRTRSAAEYFRRRAKRILPGYWLALAFSLVLGSFLTRLPLRVFWQNAATWKYIFFNLLFLNFVHPDLPGVFAANPVTNAMDGALWTIKIEVAFYLMVPLLVWLVRKFSPLWILGGVFTTSLLYRVILEHMGRPLLAKQIPGQLSFFMVGAAVYYFFPQFVAHRKQAWIAALVLLPIALVSGWSPVEALATPLFVMCVAFLLPPLRGITKYGDFSYGTYVLHYPIIQTLIAFGIFVSSPWMALGLTVICVSISSVVSWFSVERRFLRPARVRQQETETNVEVV